MRSPKLSVETLSLSKLLSAVQENKRIPVGRFKTVSRQNLNFEYILYIIRYLLNFPTTSYVRFLHCIIFNISLLLKQEKKGGKRPTVGNHVPSIGWPARDGQVMVTTNISQWYRRKFTRDALQIASDGRTPLRKSSRF